MHAVAEVVAPNYALAFATFYCRKFTRRLRYQHVLCALHCAAWCVVQVVVPNESKELVGGASKQALEAEVAPLAAALQRSGLQPDAVYMLPANHISNSAVSNYALPPEAAGPPGISACVFHTVLRATVLARATVQRATVLASTVSLCYVSVCCVSRHLLCYS